MIISITIFFLAIILAFGMITFRAWEIRTMRIKEENIESKIPEISFRHVEKSMLYLTKRVIQGVVLVIAKQWFIATTKTKKFVTDKWPKVSNYFKKKGSATNNTQKPSFFQKALIESKFKIKRIKEKVKREHGEEDSVI